MARIVYTKNSKIDEKTKKERVYINFYFENDNGVLIPIQHKTIINKNGEVQYSSYRELLTIGYELKENN